MNNANFLHYVLKSLLLPHCNSAPGLLIVMSLQITLIFMALYVRKYVSLCACMLADSTHLAIMLLGKSKCIQLWLIICSIGLANKIKVVILYVTVDAYTYTCVSANTSCLCGCSTDEPNHPG